MSEQGRKWIRVRFYANPDDYRPVKWPPPGPYWCTGYSDEHSIVVAFVRKKSQVHEFWPEALVDEFYPEKYDEPEFTDRFRRPHWWKEGA